MKRFFLVLSATLISFTIFAQQQSKVEVIKKRFNLTLSIYNDSWQHVPDSITKARINIGYEVTGIYNLPMDHKNKFFFFVGAGISSHSFNANALYGQKKIADGIWNSYMYSIPSTVNGVSITHKSSKLVFTYLELPFGFRYDFPDQLHVTAGFKVGLNINNHWKYKGGYFEPSNSQFITGQMVVQKYARLMNIADMSYGPYFTIGYKWYGLSVFYQMSSVYNVDRGPNLAPLSIGVTFRPVR